MPVFTLKRLSTSFLTIQWWRRISRAWRTRLNKRYTRRLQPTPNRLPARRLDSNLPMTWALACCSFCGLIEISRWSSPMSLITSSKPVQTVGDYTVGGAAAGAAFRGMQVAQKRSSRPPSILSGMASGMMLGFFAGVVQYAADVGEEMVEEERQRRWQQQDSNEPPEAPTSP